MTPTTEEQRAEFDAWLDEAYGPYSTRREWMNGSERDLAWAAWQAATAAASRRSPPPAAEAGWINVEERLPEKGQQVIAYRPTATLTQDEPVAFVRYTGRPNTSWQGIEHGFDHICHPTHWMPLPPPPAITKAGKKGE